MKLTVPFSFFKFVTVFHTGFTISTLPKSIVSSLLVFGVGSAVSFNIPAGIITFTSPDIWSKFLRVNSYSTLFSFPVVSISTNSFPILSVTWLSSFIWISVSFNLLFALFKNSSVPTKVIFVSDAVTGTVFVIVHIGALKSINLVSISSLSLTFGSGVALSFNAPAGISTFTFPVLTSKPFVAFKVNV